MIIPHNLTYNIDEERALSTIMASYQTGKTLETKDEKERRKQAILADLRKDLVANPDALSDAADGPGAQDINDAGSSTGAEAGVPQAVNNGKLELSPRIGKQRVETERHRQIFEVWYLNNRNIQATAKQLALSHMPLRRYIDWFDWHAKADARDNALNQGSEIDYRKMTDTEKLNVVKEVVDFHRMACKTLIDSGMAYILENGVDNSRDAVAAIKAGIELERRSLALPDHIMKVMGQTDAELIQRARELADEIARARELREANEQRQLGEVIDAEVVPQANENEKALVPVNVTNS